MTKRKPPEEHKPDGRPKRWTEDEALYLANALLSWMHSDPQAIYWEEFIYEVAPRIEDRWRDLYPDLISDLTGQYPKFSRLLKRAKKIQEIRLVRKEGKGEIKSMFILKNHHGYADKQEIKSDSTVHQTVKDVSEVRQLSEEDLKERLRWLTESPSKH